MSDLLPCPFCGCSHIKDSDSGPTGTVMCMNCFASASKERWSFGITRHIPEGYALVPVDPTHKMHLAGESAYEGGMSEYPDASAIYKSMITAAQEPTND